MYTAYRAHKIDVIPRIVLEILETDIRPIRDRRKVQRPVNLIRVRVESHHNVVSCDVGAIGVERCSTIRNGGDLVRILVPCHATDVQQIVATDAGEGHNIDQFSLVRIVDGNGCIEKDAIRVIVSQGYPFLFYWSA